MALQGSIQEFGLADIFQLIGIQRKTGTLVLSRNSESVSIKFHNGSVVEAETQDRSVEDLLGSVLVRTGRITQLQLNRALGTQKKTLQRLGHILVDEQLITEEQLIEGLRIQALQIIYRLFRWNAGLYAFEVTADVDYDDRHFPPIEAETILMEGARMVDEWPLIERRIKSDQMVLRLTPEAEALPLEAGPGGPADGGLDQDLDAVFDGDMFGSGEALPEEEEENPLSEEEREILRLVDGQNTVQWINDHSPLGEFDTYRILADLVTRKLLEEVEIIQERQRRSLPVIDHMVAWTLRLAILAGAAIGVALLSTNLWSPWQLTPVETTDELRFYASLSRLERLQQALRTFYLDTGIFPTDLDQLATESYLRPQDLLDPWGRRFGYHLSGGGYELFGQDGTGERPAELTISYRFTAAQRLVQSERLPTSP